MPRDLSALSGAQSGVAQIPVKFLLLEIPGNTIAVHDLDRPLWFNPTTGAVGYASGSGRVQFLPYAGFVPPAPPSSETDSLAACTATFSNADGAFNTIVAANAYPHAPATLWRGNLTLAANASPDAFTFVGTVREWRGEVVQITRTRQTATVRLGPPNPLVQPWPYRVLGPPDFPHIPVPGTRIVWGYTEKTV